LEAVVQFDRSSQGSWQVNCFKERDPREP